jgi:Flp pilus assembly pilin Flp
LLFKGIISNRRKEIVMVYLVRGLTSLTVEEDGQTLVEYALILVLVSIAAVTLLASIGAYPSSVFSHLNADF